MTVCIAAICQEKATILGACDRMMTAGDIEFEPDLDSLNKPSDSPLIYNTNAKIFQLTTSIVAMTAGDSGLQAEVIASTRAKVSERISAEPQKWLDVKDAVDFYLESYNKAKAKRVHDFVFAPLGLDANTFLSRQHELNANFILDVTKRLQRFESDFQDMHGADTIITGIDTTPHIYRITKSLNGNDATCCDSIGFAAIGSGARHAESQFMLSGHNPHSDRDETLLLTYLAKKRSEIAPGVGKGTDMFVIGPGLGSFAMLANIQDFNMKEIDSIYKKMEQEQAKRFQAAKEKTKQYIAAMFAARAKTPEQKQQAPTESPSTPTTPPQTS